jgi:hypothetical protein
MRHSRIWCDVVGQLSFRINLRPQFSGPHIAWKMKAAGTSAVFLTIYQTTRPHIVITNCEHGGLLCEDGACKMKSVRVTLLFILRRHQYHTMAVCYTNGEMERHWKKAVIA